MTRLGGATVPSSIEVERATITDELDYLQSESIIWEWMAETRDNFEAGASGSGAVGFGGSNSVDGTLDLATGATASSYAFAGKRASRLAMNSLSFDADMGLRVQCDIPDYGELIQVGIGGLGTGKTVSGELGFVAEGGALKARATDGTGATESTILSSPSTGEIDLRVEFTAGTEARFYADGGNETAITANLPSGAPPSKRLWIAIAENPNGADITLKTSHVRFIQP